MEDESEQLGLTWDDGYTDGSNDLPPETMDGEYYEGYLIGQDNYKSEQEDRGEDDYDGRLLDDDGAEDDDDFHLFGSGVNDDDDDDSGLFSDAGRASDIYDRDPEDYMNDLSDESERRLEELEDSGDLDEFGEEGEDW